MSNVARTISAWESLAQRTLAGLGTVTCAHGKTWSGRLRVWQLSNGCLATEFVADREPRCKCPYYGFRGNLSKGESVLHDWHMEVSDIQFSGCVNVASDPLHWHCLGTVDKNAAIYSVHLKQPRYRKIVCEVANLYLDRSVELEVEGLRVALIPRASATQMHVRDHTIGGPALTSRLRVTSNDPLGDSEWDELTRRLCYLLSLAQRNYVERAFTQHYDEDGHPFGQVLYGFGPGSTRAEKRPLIASEDLREYLRETFAHLPTLYVSWRLGQALDHYFLAMDSTSAWFRGTGIVVALECLVSAFTEAEGREYHFCDDMETFDSLLKPLAKPVLEVIESRFPERVRQLRQDTAELQSWKTGLRNLNRRSFKRKVVSMLQSLGMEAPESQLLQRFVDMRNDLIHYGYPHSEDWSVPFSKVMQMSEFLEKIVLTILGYAGPTQGIDLVYEL